jgi:hypothetical protein
MLGVSNMQGLWSRSLLLQPDGTSDTTTVVAWLQGPGFFIDLRQPEGRPSFAGVRALDDLSASHVAWLAEQEGFAGRLGEDGAFFVWRRMLDFQPPSPTPDSGRLFMQAQIMIEEGRYSRYVEHWHLAPEPRSPCAALWMRNVATGTEGFLVRVGPLFMYARSGVSSSLVKGTRLRSHVGAAPSIEAARELVDCEISLGRVVGNTWAIERSSLPYREGARLDPELDGHRCSTADVDNGGGPMRRGWEILELEGDVAALTANAALDVAGHC